MRTKSGYVIPLDTDGHPQIPKLGTTIYRTPSICLDPFGGVACGAYDALLAGYTWLGCELEPRFTALGQQNLTYWRQRYGHTPGYGQALLMQGDSRTLPVRVADLACSSPPYAGNDKADYHLSTNGKTRRRDVGRGYRQGEGCFRGSETYGATPGNMGRFPTGEVDLVASSPPYADGCSHTGGSDAHPEHVEGGEVHHVAYGIQTGQMGEMKLGDVRLVCEGNPDRMLLSIENTLPGDPLWHSVQTAVPPYQKKPTDAKSAVESTSVASLKAGQNHLDTAHTSPPQNITNPCPSAGATLTPIGQEAMIVGEAMHGASNGVPPSSVISTPVHVVAIPPGNSKSTIKKVRKRPKESGIIASTISKPSVSDATLPTIDPQNTTLNVSSVNNPVLVEAHEHVVLRHVDANHSEEKAREAIGSTPNSISANNAVHPFPSQDDQSFVQKPVSAAKRMLPHEQHEYEKHKKEENETFWSASKVVLAQVYAALKPQGHAIFITKNYIRTKQIVPFSADWVKLCEAVGFRLLHWHHAMLVERFEPQGDLFSGEVVPERRRESFFRRLARNQGSPEIPCEDVLCFVKDGPGTPAGDVDVCCSSPPWCGVQADVVDSLDPTQQARHHDKPVGPHSMVVSQGYGTTPGNLGQMAPGSVDACVSSPPYAHGLSKEQTYADGRKPHHEAMRQIFQDKGIPEPFYGTTPGQMGTMPAGEVADAGD